MPAARKHEEGPLEDGWMTVPQAAAALGCSRLKVMNHVARNELSAGVFADRTLISRESVERLRR
jgi:excisionase family DNA binding protein